MNQQEISILHQRWTFPSYRSKLFDQNQQISQSTLGAYCHIRWGYLGSKNGHKHSVCKINGFVCDKNTDSDWLTIISGRTSDW